MRPTVTLYVPHGYESADEFLRDCQFERADQSQAKEPEASGEVARCAPPEVRVGVSGAGLTATSEYMDVTAGETAPSSRVSSALQAARDVLHGYARVEYDQDSHPQPNGAYEVEQMCREALDHLPAPAQAAQVAVQHDPARQLALALADIDMAAYNAAKLRIQWALEAISAQPPAQGWKLVPLKPTKEMVDVGCDNNPTQWGEGTERGFAADVANDVYVSMVRAAQPPSAPLPPGTWSHDGYTLYQTHEDGTVVPVATGCSPAALEFIVEKLNEAPDGAGETEEPAGWQYRFKDRGEWTQWANVPGEVEVFREIQADSLAKGHVEQRPVYARSSRFSADSSGQEG